MDIKQNFYYTLYRGVARSHVIKLCRGKIFIILYTGESLALMLSVAEIHSILPCRQENVYNEKYTLKNACIGLHAINVRYKCKYAKKFLFCI